MNKKRSIYIVTGLILILSIGFNIYQFLQIKRLEGLLGSRYQTAVLSGINQVNERELHYVLEELENGNEVAYVTWQKNIEVIYTELQRTNNIHFTLLGDLINHVRIQAGELSKEDGDYNRKKDFLTARVSLINEVLAEVAAGIDENETRWYKEVSNVDSKIQNMLKKI
ncbi:MAG: hypothetical protein LRY73_09210 [Bacillus sp. (in: Bacteria)]|nr:hypothetical protein [Bacillus sp. (in: firmicutes)]